MPTIEAPPACRRAAGQERAEPWQTFEVDIDDLWGVAKW
jgi:hypothetical protein